MAECSFMAIMPGVDLHSPYWYADYNIPQPPDLRKHLKTGLKHAKTPSRMSYIAQKIATETPALKGYFKSANLPLPSSEPNADRDFNAKLPEPVRRS